MHQRSNTLAPGSVEEFIQPKSAALFGGINYRPKQDANINIPTLYSQADSLLRQMIMETTRSQLALVKRQDDCAWPYLRQSLLEIYQLNNILQNYHIPSTRYHGHDATEEAFKVLGENGSAPNILHLATHGFYLPKSGSDSTRANPLKEFSPVYLADHPLFYSGLILANAEQAWCAGQFSKTREDGVLMAYEITGMDLSETQLVILSACETGLGVIQGGEGVYGLQRAFKLAGVDYVMVNLWLVPDSKETIEFMETFYKLWLSGQNIRQAFQQTQKQMREKYPDPFYWAGFALID
jgi:CHAT domain-containing protein